MMNSMQRRILLQLKTCALRQRASLSTEIYYDSQSGLHVPIHNEKKISIFLNISNVPTSPQSFVPAQFYKEDSSSDIPDKLQALAEMGITGLWLPPAEFPRDLRNLQSLNNVAPPGFRFFASVASPLNKPVKTLSVLNEFQMNADINNLQEIISQHIESGTSTTLRLGKHVCGDSDKMSVASQLATLIDATGGANYLWLTPHESADGDDVIELCEELMYLDVAGPTIKSRIVMDSIKEEVIDETMLLGINKFVVEDESQVDVISDVAKAQGKELALP